MTMIIFSYQMDQLVIPCVNQLGAERGEAVFDRYADGEAYVRIKSEVKSKRVILFAALNNPDEKIPTVLYFATIAKQMGANHVEIVVPYLCYMRQDDIFNEGEGNSATIFCSLLANYFDALITIDPHLHRIRNLNDIFPKVNQVLHSNELIAAWIQSNVENPLLIGPDSESKQWVAAVAESIGAPYIVFSKVRLSDTEVKSEEQDMHQWQSHQAVIIDDMITTAGTMISIVKQIIANKLAPPICLAVHPVFCGSAYEKLQQAGVKTVVTCNTLEHASNGIDVSGLVISALKSE